jgi:hypothetical protein
LEETGTIDNVLTSPTIDTVLEVGLQLTPLDLSTTDPLSPLIIDDSATNTCPTCRPQCLSFGIHQAANDWTEHSNLCSDLELVLTCVADVTTACDAPGSDGSIFEPAPANILHVLKIQNPTIHHAWIKAYRKEFTTLLNSKTFIIYSLQPDEKFIPIIDINWVKINSDGTLETKNSLRTNGLLLPPSMP